MNAIFANAAYVPQRQFLREERARLYALASQVWDQVHYAEPRNNREIELLLLEMQQIVDRKNKTRRK